MSSVTSSREYKESDSESEYCSPCFSSAYAMPEMESRSLTLYALDGETGSEAVSCLLVSNNSEDNDDCKAGKEISLPSACGGCCVEFDCDAPANDAARACPSNALEHSDGPTFLALTHTT